MSGLLLLEFVTILAGVAATGILILECRRRG